jgi:hypothetical protein
MLACSIFGFLSLMLRGGRVDQTRPVSLYSSAFAPGIPFYPLPFWGFGSALAGVGFKSMTGRAAGAFPTRSGSLNSIFSRE